MPCFMAGDAPDFERGRGDGSAAEVCDKSPCRNRSRVSQAGAGSAERTGLCATITGWVVLPQKIPMVCGGGNNVKPHGFAWSLSGNFA